MGAENDNYIFNYKIFKILYRLYNYVKKFRKFKEKIKKFFYKVKTFPLKSHIEVIRHKIRAIQEMDFEEREEFIESYTGPFKKKVFPPIIKIYNFFGFWK